MAMAATPLMFSPGYLGARVIPGRVVVPGGYGDGCALPMTPQFSAVEVRVYDARPFAGPAFMHSTTSLGMGATSTLPGPAYGTQRPFCARPMDAPFTPSTPLGPYGLGGACRRLQVGEANEMVPLVQRLRTEPPSKVEHPGATAKEPTSGFFMVNERTGWQSVPEEEDLQLKRAFLAGFPATTYRDAWNSYEVDFTNMVRITQATGEAHELKAPFGWRPPTARKEQGSAKAYVAAGAAGAPGMNRARTTLGEVLAQMTPQSSEERGPPASAPSRNGCEPGVGRFFPRIMPMQALRGVVGSDAAVVADAEKDIKPRRQKSNYTTGEVTAMALAAGAGAGAAGIVGGAVLDGELRGDGWGPALEDLGRAAGDEAEVVGEAIIDAGEAIADVAEVAADWAYEAAQKVEAFVEDLF